jgi:osmotically-inducible protein OsmY
LAAAAFFSLAIVLGLNAGHAQQPQDDGPAERAGEQIDKAGQNLKKKLQQAGDSIRNQFEQARRSVHSMSIESRVYGRLHWDKALQGSTLNLEMKNGIVTLQGSVPNSEAKLKAVELARDTVGITQVIDQLAIQPPPQSTPASSTGKTSNR